MAIHNRHPGFDSLGTQRVINYYVIDKKTILEISKIEHCSLKRIRQLLVSNNIKLVTSSEISTANNKVRWTPEQRVLWSQRQKNVPKKSLFEHLQDCIKVHGDLYDYSKVIFTVITQKVSIVCKIHGEFMQLLSNHKVGRGCPKCKTKRLIGGYNEKHFTRNPLAKDWDSIFYIVKLQNNDEEFIKCGITNQRLLSSRLSGQLNGYKYTIINTEQLPLYEAYKKEQGFIKQHQKFVYKPLIRFDGWTECFNIKILKVLL